LPADESEGLRPGAAGLMAELVAKLSDTPLAHGRF